MTLRFVLCLVAPIMLAMTSCTTTYQQMLHERDLKITQLENANAQLRAAARELERREKSSRDESQALRDRLATNVTSPADAAAQKSEVQQVQDELKDLDVGYRRGHVSIGIENEVTFSSGSIDLKPGAGSVLERVGAVLKRRFPDRRIYVEGHTDTDPINKTKAKYRSNRHLSAERADIVAGYLVEKCGLQADHVVVVGFGPYDPKLDGKSDAAKAKNRRVEIVVGEPK
jgi:chemotaxis protein MotB